MPPSASSILPTFDLTAPVKAPRLVSEQLGLEQVLGDRRAVDGDEAALAAALLVDGAREQFLAGAACAEQHHGHVGASHPLDGLGDLRAFPARRR